MFATEMELRSSTISIWQTFITNYLIAAPAEKIYNAITSQEGLSAWWIPGVNSKPEVNSVACFPFGPDYFIEMKLRN
jgi:uncharacterized protein YndB with AHSA1/START domain